MEIEEALDIVYAIPVPDELFSEIFLDKTELKSGIVAPIESGDNLVYEKSIALIKGVFISDMAYMILLDENYYAVNYFKTILRLSDRLELGHLQNQDLLNSIEYNIGNKDTLEAIFNESINDIRYELENSKRDKTLALIYTGLLVETLYLAIQNIH